MRAEIWRARCNRQESGHSSSNEGNRGAGEGRPAHQSRYSRRSVQLIDAEGHNHGVVDLADAQQRADEASLDLSRSSPTRPRRSAKSSIRQIPVSRAEQVPEARKRQKVVEIKEIKLRPGIDDHDYE